MANRDYSDNDFTNPARTHPDIKLNVPIPHVWESVSYSNDVCPSFAYNGLQIFVCDEETKKREELHTKYTVMLEDDYGCGYDSLLDTDDWYEVLKYVSNHVNNPTLKNHNHLMEKNLKLVAGFTLDEFQNKCENYKIHSDVLDRLIFELANEISIEEFNNEKK